jgi:outer membrane protein assembly factor BamA
MFLYVKVVYLPETSDNFIYSGLFFLPGIRRIFLFFLFLVLYNQSIAQQRFTVVYKLNSGEIPIPGKIKFAPVTKDSVSVQNQIQQVIRQLQKQSYLLASVDSLVFCNDTIITFIHTGNSFKWAELKPGNVEENVLSSVGYREKIYKNKAFSYQEVASIEGKILDYADNQGYPFASISFDSIQIMENKISATLHYTKGPFIIFDTLAIEGSAKFKKRFLSTYLRILAGEPFSQKKVKRAEILLKQLPYLTVTKPFSIIFKNDRAYPVFYADQLKANEIDGILGFLPNEQAQNKMLVTGELNLQLKNLFNSGKNFSLKWQQIRQNSPRLDVSYEHPALFGTPLIFTGNFNILKEDTTFLTINRQVNFAHHTGNAGEVSFYSGLKTSQLGNNIQYTQSEQLPVFTDSKLIYYGTGYRWQNLDNYFNPTRGLEFSVNGWVGNRRIVKNPFVRQDLYDNVNLTSMQFQIKGSINKFIPLSDHSVLVGSLKVGKVISSHLFKNDLFRVGGLTTLRGHNENFFFASDYALLTLEYRFFVEPTSYLLLFYDQAYIKYDIPGSYYEDNPLGLGTGVSFTTKVGIFQLIYALGQAEGRKLGFNFSRIHFGITSRF